MATELLYLREFDVITCDARVLSAGKNDDGRFAVALDQTCFYPRGGGQDWDTGRITSERAEFAVHEVRLDENGTAQHIGELQSGVFVTGDAVTCRVDEERRDANTRLHSSGHVIDMAMTEVAPDWVPGKGAHYPHMSFVEYAVPDGAAADESLVQRLQAKINELLQNTYQNNILFISKDEMSKYCRHVPDNIPTNKPSRIVLYADDFGIPCGGTHVKQVGDIGELKITKIKIKKGIAKVSYAVTGIN